MIRRNMKMADGSAGWALISQVEHARISRQLAQQCIGLFDNPELESVRREVMAAIGAHDDGWPEWDQSPRLDDDSGKPLSFMELPTAEALQIWSRSILRAESHGPLAAWMVAGHFVRLIENSAESSRGGDLAASWQADMQRRREHWLAAWQTRSPTLHTVSTADEALRWLWTFDEVSLWLCCACPTVGETAVDPPEPYSAGQGTQLAMKLWADLDAGDPPAGAVDPWRFKSPTLETSATSLAVPAHHYASASALLAAGQPLELKWRLAPRQP